MTKLKADGSSDAKLIPEGSYDGTLVKIEEKSNANGSYLLWTFVLQVRGQEAKTAGVTNATLEAGSKCRFWCEAFLGRLIKDGEEVDLDRLTGRTARIILTTKELENGTIVNRVARVEKTRARVLTAGKGPDLPDEGHESEIDEEAF